jgi:Domain of unknown function (DUF4375)
MIERGLYWLQGIGALALGAAVLWLVIRINSGTHKFIDSLAKNDSEKDERRVDKLGQMSTITNSGNKTDVADKPKPVTTDSTEKIYRPEEPEAISIVAAPEPAVDEHPSHVLHKEIRKKFEAAGHSHEALDERDRNFLRAYEFDSRLLNGGFDDFFAMVSSPKAWNETVLALSAVGANEWAELFESILRSENETLSRYYADGHAEDIEDLEIWDDWSAKFWAARSGSEFEEKVIYMETLLDRYSTPLFR